MDRETKAFLEAMQDGLRADIRELKADLGQLSEKVDQRFDVLASSTLTEFRGVHERLDRLTEAAVAAFGDVEERFAEIAA